MLKYIFNLVFFFSASTLSALDSGTLSATLCYQLADETSSSKTKSELFNRLLNQLEEEQASPELIQEVTDQFHLFQSGVCVNNAINDLWLHLTDIGYLSASKYYNDFSDNPLIGSKKYKAMKPWVLPSNHPMRARLDSIFLASRAIKDSDAFQNAGFITFKVQPRSFIRVARHPELPGYLVKVYLDDELRLKRNKEGWTWFVKRCQGAKRIAKIIETKKIKNFVVSKKWIYPLPIKPKPPTGPEYAPKTEILIAEDMNIVSLRRSKEAWLTAMTPKHLDELYIIISYGRGRSYRPDNIPYTRDGKFAFIDTEYPDEKANFATPKAYLSPEMAVYWQKLIDKGGP